MLTAINTITTATTLTDERRVFALVEAMWSECVEARRASAANPLCPEWVLVEFSKDTAPSVRFAVAGNPVSSVSVLSALADDSVEQVSRLAKARLNA